jgi:energy-coupling factor transport system ATP-binding protein
MQKTDDVLIESGSLVVVCGLTGSAKGEFLDRLRPAQPEMGEAGATPFLADMRSLLGVGGLARRQAASLSGGQRQRLALAGQLARQFPTFVLDEPTAHLDPAGALLLLSFLIRLNREQGATVVISDRHLEELLPASSRVLFFAKDRLYFDGNTQDFIVKVSASAQAFTRALPATITIPLIRHMKASAEKGHDAMAGTYLVANYPVSVAEARARLAAWPEVAAAQAEAALGAEAAPKPAAPPGQGPAWLEAEGVRLLPGRSLALLGDNGSGKSRLLEALAAQAGQAGRAALRLAQELRRGEDQLAALTGLLGRAEAAPPGLLLLDEPTAGVDSATAWKQAKRLAALKARGWSIALATQDLEFAASVADSCQMLADGRLSQPAPPQDFFDNAPLYTTVANRVTRGYFERCVSLADLRAHL